MNETSCVCDAQILKIWDWCVSAYVQHGRKLSFPKGTDPSKTYQWRYATAIAKKFDELGFDDITARRILQLAIAHSKNAGTMQKGLAAILQGNILEICLKRIQSESESNTQTIGSLQRIHAWLSKKIIANNLLATLLHRDDPEGFCNLTVWFQGTRITPLYLSLSKSCSSALARLNKDYPEERALLPKQTYLYVLRDDFLHDAGNLTQARNLFVNDWREPCLLPS
jgi:septum formation topological specificity factor MinE